MTGHSALCMNSDLQKGNDMPNTTRGTIARRTITKLGLAAPALALLPRGLRAADAPVRIGAPYPLTGVAASAGTAVKQAIEVAVDVINNAHPELPNLPLAATEGLPGLGGRKVEVIFADHQGNPAIAQSEALRLITQDKVAAIVGCYQSSCGLTASAVAERYGIPFMASEASAPSLTERGFKWFFRPTPIGTDFGLAYASFLVDRKAAGFKIEKIAVVNENTEYGTSTGNAIIAAATEKGLKIDTRIFYNANSSDVSAQVLQLKSAGVDAVIFVSYTSDSILFMKTMHTLNWKPPILIGDDSGFSDNAFIEAVGDLAQGVFNRSSYDAGKPGSASFVMNEIYQKHAGHALDDTSARGMQGFLALMEAINRAGSTEPAKIQAALVSQDLKPDQLMIGYNGIKYDAKGQNTLAATLLVQLEGKKYVSVWPDKAAARPPVLPFKGWG
ncbi:MAG: branched-chain amino acid transport system substrate-binding protein [Acetobacteraceae bacterium]|nr:branched-chain amino acid transport system substrate-binding protein [Acetobacteraceae bacterium]